MNLRINLVIFVVLVIAQGFFGTKMLAQSVYTSYTFTTLARFGYPTSVAVDSVGNIYVADTGNNIIRKVTPDGMATTLAGLAGSSGSTDGTGSMARFNGTRGVATDSVGNVYVVDNFNSTIRKVSPVGVVTTLAGLAGNRGSSDGARATRHGSIFLRARLWTVRVIYMWEIQATTQSGK